MIRLDATALTQQQILKQHPWIDNLGDKMLSRVISPPARNLSTGTATPRRRTLLLTFDAFDTLFTPRKPVAEQYASVAHEFGLSHTAITPESIKNAFKGSFKAQAKRYPNYGRADVLRGLYGGPRQWWADVIHGTLAGALSSRQAPNNGTDLETASNNQVKSLELPSGLVETLVDRFAGAQGYALFDDVEPFFARMREVKRAARELSPYERILVGVVSNSDDRVPAVLSALGLRVGELRADQDRSSMELPGFEEKGKSEIHGSVDRGSTPGSTPGIEEQAELDIDMVITSYEAGEEKPNPLIFDVAKRQAGLLLPGKESNENLWCVHVGDDYEKDYVAACDAGWRGCYLDREGGSEYPGLKVHSLMDLVS